MRIIVTGSTGYIGERLVQLALSQGHEVIAASRRPPTAQVTWIPFDFTSVDNITVPDRIDTIFHLAAATASVAMDPDTERLVAGKLIDAAKQAGAKFVFVSSQTAREDAPTAYGRTKWQIERLVLAAGGWVVRPGQVYGGPEHALFGALVRAIRDIPMIPAFFPAPKVQPVHVDDLAKALLQCAVSDNIPSSVLCIGAADPIPFTDFLRTIAQARVQRYSLFIPIPVVLVRLASIVSGKHLRTQLGLDRLASLCDLPVMATQTDLHLLGITLRPLPSGMTRSGNNLRRSLIHEGQALLAYVLRDMPTQSLVRRYVRSIERLRGGHPLHLPQIMLRAPVTIALLDDPHAPSPHACEELAWRLNAAVVLAEASVQGSRRFLDSGGRNGFVLGLTRISYAIVLELCWRTLRLIARPVLKPWLVRCG